MNIDSFSGPLSDLKPRERDAAHALAVLARHPRISGWDLETGWLRLLIDHLRRDGLIEHVPEAYPWVHCRLTAAGHAALAQVDAATLPPTLPPTQVPTDPPNNDPTHDLPKEHP